MSLTPVWFLLPREEVAILAPPKCGSTTIARATRWHNHHDKDAKGDERVNWKSRRDGECVTDDGVPEGWKLYQVVRNPIDRFESLWRHQHRKITPEALVNKILRGPCADMHWITQTMYRERMNPTPVPLERVEKLLEQLGVEWLPQEPILRNATEGKVPEYNVAPLYRHYESDFHLYNEALLWTGDNS